MNRNTTIGASVVLMFALGIPAFGANKDMIQLEDQIKQLGNQMERMQQSIEEKLGARRNLLTNLNARSNEARPDRQGQCATSPIASRRLVSAPAARSCLSVSSFN